MAPFAGLGAEPRSSWLWMPTSMSSLMAKAVSPPQHQAHTLVCAAGAKSSPTHRQKNRFALGARWVFCIVTS